MEMPAVTPRAERGALRRVAATTAAALALAVPLAGTAGAQAQPDSVLDESAPCPPGVNVTRAPFTDRDSVDTTHALNVDCAAALRIAVGGAGGTSGRFDPDGPVRRDQMASFIVRALELPDASGAPRGYTLPTTAAQFPDVPADNEHAANIRKLRSAGIALGRDGNYNPGEPVNRDEMASFLVRAAAFAYGENESTLRGTGATSFGDVPVTNPHKASIDAANELFGLVLGRTTTTYDPGGVAQRDEMTTFLVRLVDITLLDPNIT